MEISATAWFVVRLLTCSVWIGPALYKLIHPRSFADLLVGMGYTFLPLPSTYAVIVLKLGGSLLVLLDFQVWLVACAWIAFVVYGSWLEHRRILNTDGSVNLTHYTQLFKNISIIGSLCALIVLDPGKPAWLAQLLSG